MNGVMEPVMHCTNGIAQKTVEQQCVPVNESKKLTYEHGIAQMTVEQQCVPVNESKKLTYEHGITQMTVEQQCMPVNELKKLTYEHGIAQMTVDYSVEQGRSESSLNQLELLTHETYYLREVLFRAGVKYKPYAPR